MNKPLDDLLRETLRARAADQAAACLDAERAAAFVDGTTGLYGRPDRPGWSLIGLPGDRWDVPAASQWTSRDLVRRSLALIGSRFGPELAPGQVLGVVARADCFSDRPGDLPEPEGPMKATYSPRLMLMVTERRAWISSVPIRYTLEMLEVWITGGSMWVGVSSKVLRRPGG